VRRYAYHIESYLSEGGKCPECKKIAYGIY